MEAAPSAGAWQLGVDVGGTFTDLVLDDGSSLRVAKVLSTSPDQAQGVLAGLAALGIRSGSLGRFVHGTTVGTNAVLERRGARTVLVTTEGFRDVLEIGRQNRPKLYDLFADRPVPVVPRDLVVEVPERVGPDGSVLLPVTALESVTSAVRALAPESIAVSLLFSFLHPRHEHLVGEAMRRLGLPVSLSCEVLPVFREYERASTTVLNAYVSPALRRYLGSLARELRSRGMGCELEVMRSGGGTLTADLAAKLAVHTLLSGPAAGAWGAAAIGGAAGYSDLIAFDMGGTSTDATLIEAGRPRTTAEGSIDDLPFAVTSTEVHTVGAGGGSVAWQDSGGALRVGPRSAGADPGPACYGRGGVEPTVTDAYLMQGLLDPATLLGGTLRVQWEPALAAVQRLAQNLGMEATGCAGGVLRVLEGQVGKALRVVSVERGRDPRRYALLAFGGAGPLHQGPLARELGCPVVIVPRFPGVLSALGLLAAPVSIDLGRTVLGHRSLSAEEAERIWSALEADALQVLRRQGVPAERLERGADCRYHGQAHELRVAAPVTVIGASPTPGSPASTIDAIGAAFIEAHRQRYGYVHEGETIEVVTLRARAEGPAPAISPLVGPEGRGAEWAYRGTRSVHVDGAERDCPLYQREALAPGDRFSGPAVVIAPDSTCLVLGGQRAEVDAHSNLLIREG